MCGIAGVLCRDPRPDGWLDRTVRRMTRAIAHRGPDHEDAWESADHVMALGYRRLAILDLSPDGHQPMHAEAGRYAIVFNGEIYNFIELRDELSAAGVVFRSRSDTEVLLAAIVRWGIETALARAAGMFAIAVWDARERRLWLARDRAGKKPLYFATHEGAFYFASEIKALKHGASLPLTTDTESIHHYLSLGYVPAPRTVYREVREVPAGCWMEVGPTLAPSTHRYWALPPPSPSPVSRQDAITELDRLLAQAVAQRMRADVPVGVFLSGGIDSGLVTAYAARTGGPPLRTFTVTFAEGAYDEGPLAASVAARYATNHQTIRLAPDVEELLPRVAAAYDEPFADPSALPTFAIAEAASRELKVVLNGEGADELFAGYRRHVAAWRAARLDRMLPIPGRAVRCVAGLLPNPKKVRTTYSFLHRAARGFGLGAVERYLVWSTDGFTDSEVRALFRDGLAGVPPTADTLGSDLAWTLGRGDVADFMTIDFVLSLGDCLLVKMDIATMAHSLEARSPFLDHRVVEWAARLPRELLFADGGTKSLLRALAARYLPPPVVAAPKRGFEIPLVDWVRADLRPMIRDLCLSADGLVCEMFDRVVVERLIDRRGGAQLDDERWAKRLWILLMLALWDRVCRKGASRFESQRSVAV